MIKPLPDTASRCHGNGCSNKEVCKRHLTIAVDTVKAPRYEYRVRAYYQTLIDKKTGLCKHFKEDD